MHFEAKPLLRWIAGLLIVTAIASAVLGFSLAMLTGKHNASVPRTDFVVTTTFAEKTHISGTPVLALTSPPTADNQPELRTSSTLRPTSVIESIVITSTNTIVRYGESLYQICRRNCPGIWRPDVVPPSLVQYAQVVCQRNNIPWNNGHPVVYPGQHLVMPVCPQP